MVAFFSQGRIVIVIRTN